MEAYLESLQIGASPILDKWFLMQSPWPMFSIILVYLAFVAVVPKIMKNRKPFKLKGIILFYNAVQVYLSALMCYKVLNANVFQHGLSYVGCQYPLPLKTAQLLEISWYYAMAKQTELLDTVFFILRKKENQVTFLHVYHHASTAIYAWLFSKYAADGQGTYFVLLNSGVHVVMYTYYLLSGLGPQVQKYLWWKKYVTVIQLIQFVEMIRTIIVNELSRPYCELHRGFTSFVFFDVLLFLYLFSRFYIRSYNKKITAKTS